MLKCSTMKPQAFLKLLIFINFLLGCHSSLAAISEESFWGILEKMDRIYAPIFEAKGLNLRIIADFESDWPLAESLRMQEDSVIQVTYSFAKTASMTEASFAFAICHEIGHHLGEIKITGIEKLKWGSSHDEADYFAATQCMPKIIEAGVISPEFKGEGALQNGAAELCNHFFPKANEDIQKCLWNINMAFNVIETLAELSPLKTTMPSLNFEKDQSNEISQDFSVGYSSLSCRLNTIISGFMTASTTKIPFGKVSTKRPTCWFNLNK